MYNVLVLCDGPCFWCLKLSIGKALSMADASRYRINANAYKQCFWMMAHLMSRRGLLAALREQISPVVRVGTCGLEYRLEQQFSRLKAIYLEVLRLSASSSTLRGVILTTEVGDQILKRDARILIPYRQLHMNPDTFGEDADRFNPDRFLPNKFLSRNPSFRPFGVGKTYCPGCYLAEREVLTFIALAITHFDIDLVEAGSALSQNRGFPRIDKKKFCLGIMEPVKGDDLILDIKERT